MKTLTINLPDKFDLTPKETATLLAAKLYETGKLSLGQAAELAGYSKKTFWSYSAIMVFPYLIPHQKNWILTWQMLKTIIADYYRYG